jgi:hypothetical protein
MYSDEIQTKSGNKLSNPSSGFKNKFSCLLYCSSRFTFSSALTTELAFSFETSIKNCTALCPRRYNSSCTIEWSNSRKPSQYHGHASVYLVSSSNMASLRFVTNTNHQKYYHHRSFIRFISLSTSNEFRFVSGFETSTRLNIYRHT